MLILSFLTIALFMPLAPVKTKCLFFFNILGILGGGSEAWYKYFYTIIPLVFIYNNFTLTTPSRSKTLTLPYLLPCKKLWPYLYLNGKHYALCQRRGARPLDTTKVGMVVGLGCISAKVWSKGKRN